MTNVVQVGKHSASIGEWRYIDAVIFVHGLWGHYRDTWGDFPELLDSDLDLPDLDVLLWGYTSPFVGGGVRDTETLGKNLVSELRLRLRDDAAACLVAHSMGGLVVFEGLVGEMRRKRAQEPPVSSVELLSLFAVPTTGSTLAAAAKRVVKRLGLPASLLNEQVRSLTDEACETLLGEVHLRIYDPQEENETARRIPIRVVVASGDVVVDEPDADMAQTPFQNPAPLEFDHGHRSVKLPSSHHDVRYLALSHDLQTVVTKRFVEFGRRFLDSADEDRDDAARDVERRYGTLLRRRFEDAGGDPMRQQQLYVDYREMVIRDCEKHRRPPFDAANRAVTILREENLLGDGG